MKRTTLSLMFLLAISCLIAQEPDVREQILGYKDSEYDFVNKGRRLLIDHLEKFKMQEAIDVKNGLLGEFEGNVSEAFYVGEYIHLLFWTGEFDELLNYLKQVDTGQPVSNNVRVSSQTDNFFPTVFKHTSENSDILEMDIKNAVQERMDRDFLLLLLNDVSVSIPPDERESSPHTARVNAMADQFLAEYPGSPYEKIVREHIRLVFKETDWGMYFDFGLGTFLNQGDISRQFANGAAFDMLFEYRHRKLMGMFGFGFAGQKLKQDLPINNTTWKKDASATLGNIYLNAGYLALENRRWSIYPYIGAGITGFSAVEKDIKDDENLEKLGLNSFFTQIGLGIDLKMNGFPSMGIYHSPYDSSNSRISLKYTYRMPRFERKNPLLSGSQHVITLSYGIGGRGKERDI